MSETLTTRLDRAIRNGFVGPDAANEMNRLLQEAAAEIEALTRTLAFAVRVHDTWQRVALWNGIQPKTSDAVRDVLASVDPEYVPPTGFGDAR